MRKITIATIIFILIQLFSYTLQGQDITVKTKAKLVQGDEISAALQSKRAVPVIVRLNVQTVPEKGLNNAERRNQRASIENSQQQIIDRLRPREVQNFKTPSSLPFISMFVDEATLNELGNLDEVSAIFLDKPDKPILNNSTVQIGANTAWDYGYDGSGQTVVILDTGVDIDQVFFTGRIAGGACFSEDYDDPETTKVENVSLCPNGQVSQTGAEAGQNCSEEDDPFCDHGTHVAGIAGGSNVLVDLSGQPTELNGVARGANIYTIQVFTLINDEDFCDPGPSPCVGSYASDQIEALDHIATYNDSGSGNPPLTFSSVNMSLGSGAVFSQHCDQQDNGSGTLVDVPRKVAIDNLKSSGIATIIASGNSDSSTGISSPACISSSVSVGAVDGSDVVPNFSNSATILDLLAPGVAILSSVPRDENGDSTFEFKQGTSMAAPHVAGAWALMTQANPDATVDEILTKFQNTGVDVLDTRNGLTFSRIQVDQALSETYTADIASASSQQNEGWRFISSPGLSTHRDLLSNIWTQGSANSNEPPGDPTVLEYDGTNYLAVSDLNNTLEPGKGLAVYVFEDDDNDGTSESWPKTIDVFGLQPNQDVVLDDLIFPGSSGEGNEVYSLLGNPFNSTIDFDLFSNQSQTGNVVYVYDHSFGSDSFEGDDTLGDPNVTTDAGGAFRAWNGSSGSLTDGLIAPFQGFFVYATGSDPTLTIPESSKTTGGTFYKESEILNPSMQIAARINSSYTGETWLSFTETGSIEKNSYDAPYLYPLDFKPFLSLQTRFEGTGYNIKNLPAEPESEVKIPLMVEAWEPNQDENSPGYRPLFGDVELIWPKMENIPDEWAITLTDHHLGKIVDMKNDDRYEYSTAPQKRIDTVMPYKMGLVKAVNKQTENTRFTITISPNANSQISENNLPKSFELRQNYPNPFNPTTVIRYDLPENAEVSLDVYSVSGQRVATLVNQTQQAGSYTVPFDAGRLASGVYIYQLKAGNFLSTQKMVLMK